MPKSKSEDPSLNSFKQINLYTETPWLDKFRVNGSIITYIGEDRTWTQILGSNPIYLKNRVTIRVRKSLNRQFSFGVISSKYNGHRWSRLVPGAADFVYFNTEGEIWSGYQRVKIGGVSVLEGDTIEMSFNEEKG